MMLPLSVEGCRLKPKLEAALTLQERGSLWFETWTLHANIGHFSPFFRHAPDLCLCVHLQAWVSWRRPEANLTLACRSAAHSFHCQTMTKLKLSSSLQLILQQSCAQLATCMSVRRQQELGLARLQGSEATRWPTRRP